MHCRFCPVSFENVFFYRYSTKVMCTCTSFPIRQGLFLWPLHGILYSVQHTCIVSSVMCIFFIWHRRYFFLPSFDDLRYFCLQALAPRRACSPTPPPTPESLRMSVCWPRPASTTAPAACSSPRDWTPPPADSSPPDWTPPCTAPLAAWTS